MKGYQEYFSRAQHSSYPQQYIDYSLHKSKLKQFYDRRRQLSQILKSNDGTLSDAQFKGLTHPFTRRLKFRWTARGVLRVAGQDSRYRRVKGWD
eukprot:scaffold28511_cov71-Cyclotella_meneghiniana.AAC.1